MTRQFAVDTSVNQRFILDNPNIDTSSIRVSVTSAGQVGGEREFKHVDNILHIDKSSEIFLLQEIGDEQYELLFGDGYFGKKLETGQIITVSYIITDGSLGNGPSVFDFQGNLADENGIRLIPTGSITVNTCLLYTSPSPRDQRGSRMPSSA